jgi:prepilin-type N-terminal cleavage/methylation domain-containing protein
MNSRQHAAQFHGPLARIRAARYSFTLIEMIAVIALIAVIAAWSAARSSRTRSARRRLAETAVNALATNIEQYQSDVGVTDSLDQLLTAPSDADLWLGPHAKARRLQGPWHRTGIHGQRRRHAVPAEEPGADGKPAAGRDKTSSRPRPDRRRETAMHARRGFTRSSWSS